MKSSDEETTASDGIDAHTVRRSSLRELALLFLRLGLTAFGGPAAHIAMMEDEVVRRRSWMSSEDFLDLVGATNLIPGPNSTELAIHIGRNRAGFPGLLLAGVVFIVPAAVLTGALAWGYVRFGALAPVAAMLYGVKPAIIAIVVQALVGLVPKAAKTRRLAFIGILALVSAVAHVNELAVIAGAGVLAVALELARERPALLQVAPPAFALMGAIEPAVARAGRPFGLLPLFLFFAKVGSVLFGSGYVLLAFLRADLVDRFHWLTEAQLLDAVAAGQLTPGPVFTTATFIGYVLAGPLGAALATIGIFLPSFFFVAVSAPLVPRIRASRPAAAFLDGVNVASVALMALVAVNLADAALVDWETVAIATISFFLLAKFEVNSIWLVLGGAGAGGVAHLLQ